MKDVIIGCATFLKDQIKQIRKAGEVHTKRTFNLRVIEDKVGIGVRVGHLSLVTAGSIHLQVDKDHYSTREMLLREFEEFCRKTVVADHPVRHFQCQC